MWDLRRGGETFSGEVTSAGEAMKADEALNMLYEMLQIYSPSGKEDEIASYLEERLYDLDFVNVRRDKAGNVYGEVGSGEYTILLCGHMDTVPGYLPVKWEDDKIYGRGAVDAKSSLAAMISAAKQLKSKIHNKGKIIVAGVVDEEGRARGIRQLIREGLSVNCAIFGEPSGVGNITFAYKGRILLTVKCRTKSGHVGAQHIYNNAIEAAFNLWMYIRDLCDQHRSPNGIFYSLTSSIIGIKSWRSMGGLPDRCRINVDLRVPPKFTSKDVIMLVKGAVEKAADDLNAEVSLRVLDRVEPFVARRDTLLMKSLSKAILEVTGREARFIRKTGTGDMNIFGSKMNIPVATYGPGNGRLSHTEYEYIDVSEYLMSIQVYERAIEKILCLTSN
ncbi:acetylornithine deacetylase [Candidatus Bathyarchaeota archaeon]|nr:MAG: acetylornithine deacetylase [Candidatus Bathyarchaeota archaeon]